MKIVNLLFISSLLASCTSHHSPRKRGYKRARLRADPVPARISVYPFLLRMTYKNGTFDDQGIYTFCDGAIVSRKWGTSAAHCFRITFPITDADINNKALYARGNSAKQNKCYNEHLVTTLLIHDKYNATTYDYDVALFLVHEDFSGKYEKPMIRPPKSHEYKEDTTGLFVGWGQRNSSNTERLLTVNMNIVKSDRCKEKWKAGFTSRMVCAMTKKKGPCLGDSGGPVIYENNTVIGLTSFVLGDCSHPIVPSFVTKIWVVEDLLQSVKKGRRILNKPL